MIHTIQEGGPSGLPFVFVSKECSKCKTILPYDAFPFSGGKGNKSSWCRSCHSAMGKAAKDKDPEKWRIYKKEQMRALRAEVIIAYGAFCVCCGENVMPFLALDHVNGGGNQQRETKNAWFAYRDARKRNYPDDYQVLCVNCNWGKYSLGQCPHTLTVEQKLSAVIPTSYDMKYQQKLRRHVLNGYGAVCVCCGEDTYEFLTLDHVEGGGSQERRNGGRGRIAYREAKRNNFPPEYQVLCFSCNWGKGDGKFCPHHIDFSLPLFEQQNILITNNFSKRTK